jgi:methyl-accepting chemotaxis protein
MQKIFLGLNSLGNRIRLGFIAVPILLSLLLIVYSINNLISNQNEITKRIAQNTATSYSDKVDRNFYERYGDVQAFSNNPISAEGILIPSKVKSLENYMNGLTTSYVVYDLMVVCDSTGKVIASNTINKSSQPISISHVLKTNFSSTKWFRTAAEDRKASYSDFQVSEDIIKIDPARYDGFTVVFSSPILDSTGRILGVWANFASWKEITVKIRQEMEEELAFNYPNSFLIMTDTLGRIIDASDVRLVEKQDSIFQDHLSGNQTISINKADVNLGEYVQGQSVAKGAYTYKGRHWTSYAFIPAISFSLSLLASADLNGLYLITILMIVVALYLSTYLTKQITTRLSLLQSSIDKLAQGEINRLKVDGEDELSVMAQSINALSQNLKQKVDFSEQIGHGNLESAYQLESEKDELGKSLIGMRDSLLSFNKQEERRKWATEGMAQFGEILRQNDSFEKLCDNILSKLVKYVNANQAGIFVLRENEHQEKSLDLIACFAYNRKKYLERSIKPGQGLVGQCYLEKNYIYLNDIPQDYLVITSGLGEATPDNLLLIPLSVNDIVYGVLEIASFHPFEEYQIEFFQKLSESIASSINLARSNETTRKLYEESKLMTEELRAQEEEMRQNMEELMATQEEIERKEQEYLHRIEELEKALYERNDQ